MPLRMPQLGAPGLYRAAAEVGHTLSPERMDVCAFVGVTARGPARWPLYEASWLEPLDEDERSRLVKQRRSVPRAVESWDEFERVYGGFEGPGRLPYAVAAFFANGGKRAVVVRVVHPEPGLARFARGDLGRLTHQGAPITLYARDPGTWGNRTTAHFGFTTAPLPFLAATAGSLEVHRTLVVQPGSLLRLSYPGGRALRYVVDDHREADGRRVLRLESPLPVPPAFAELVEGKLEAGDASDRRVSERFEHLGLSSSHPRWLARVLYGESTLLLPAPEWLEADLVADVGLAGLSLNLADGGDDYALVEPNDFFAPFWAPGEPVEHEGVHCLVEQSEVALICVPDLYVPEALAETEAPIDASGSAEFTDCVAPQTERVETSPPELPLLHLDPGADFEAIVTLQERLVALAEQLRGPHVLLDVPPRLQLNRVLEWRSRFDSAFAAAYHPWLKVAPPEDRREGAILLPPSSAAAGIIAARERAFGVPHGPANALAIGVVDVLSRVSPAEHDRLHPQNVNVFEWLPDGARLSAARTLSRDPQYRQLSVRRLMTLLARTLERQLQWVVFEPNGRKLRADLTAMVKGLLRGLHQQGAFTGARDEDSFFVKCDDELNPPRVTDAGQLVAHVGVAPAEPLEFIVLTVALEGGALSVEG